MTARGIAAVLAVLLPLAAGQSWLTCNAVIPASPRLLVAIPMNDQIDLTWAAPANRPCNVVYEVRVEGGSSVAGKLVPALNVTQQRASVGNLTPGTQYTVSVRVRHNKSCGE